MIAGADDDDASVCDCRYFIFFFTAAATECSAGVRERERELCQEEKVQMGEKGVRGRRDCVSGERKVHVERERQRKRCVTFGLLLANSDYDDDDDYR